MITVVSAAIVNEKGKRLLLAQRIETTSYPLLWCTPGGKVEQNESLADALVRELYEEIGFRGTMSPMPLVYRHEIKSTRTGKNVLVLCYRIDWPRVAVPLTIGDGTKAIEWFSATDLETVKLTPADDANRAKLIALVAP